MSDIFRAAIIDDWPRMVTRLMVVQRIGDRDAFLLEDGTWQTIGPGEAPPINAGIMLPADAIEAIAAAFHPRAGHKVEVERLEEALAVERRRVDDLLANLSARPPIGASE